MKLQTYIVLALSLLLLTACAPSQDYTIGWIGALTGSATQWGEPALKAAQMAVEDVNNAGGVNGKRLVLKVEDSQSKGTAAATAAHKLLNEDGVFVLFTHSSTESLAAAPIAEAAKVVLFASASSTPNLTSAGDYIFRVTPVNREGELLAATLNGKHQKIAIVSESASYTIPIHDAFVRSYTGEIVLDEVVQTTDLDVRTLALKIKAQQPDAVVISPFGINMALQLMQALDEQGVMLPIYGNAAFETPELMERARNREVSFSTLAINLSDPQVSSFIEEYEMKYGEMPNKAHTLDAATKIYIIAEALEKCDVDQECLKGYLYGIRNKPTVSGTLTIDENGDAEKAFVMMRTRQDAKE